MQESEWRDEFLFVGNQVVLDFLNTRPMQDGELLELIPDFRAFLRWLQAADLLSASDVGRLRAKWDDSGEAKQFVEMVQTLRERLRKEIQGWEEGAPIRNSTIKEINALLAAHPMRTRLKAGGGEVVRELWFPAETPQDLLTPLAHGAAALFTEVDRARVRKCGECVLYFLDTSKKGTRRWCSMRLCGNRLKVAAYAARQREE